MKIKTILFDFDGTVADTVGPVVDILNEIAPEFGLDQITEEELNRYRNQRNQDALKDTGVPKYKVLLILRRTWKEINARIPSLNPISGIEDVLRELKISGLQLGIVTTGLRDNVMKFLDNNNLDMFDFVDSGSSMFGKKKVLKRVLKEHELNPKEVIYIGDQTSDIEAAKNSGIKIIAVGWGFNLEKILKEHNPDYFVKEPKELVKILQDL